MSLALAELWDTPLSKQIAGEISSISGLYCGPAAVVWIAAVWNNMQGRSYDYKLRVKDKKLFPDGPRPFHIDLPGFQRNLNDLLSQETNHELKLSAEICFKYRSIHNMLLNSTMPVIVRMLAPRLIDGLHYVTVFKSETSDRDGLIQFYWQDNGLYGSNAANSGLSKSNWKNANSNFFLWGASGVVRV
ncbi:MAG: hypothetical protein C0490_28770 [Marivirga sp.]|nr:hypothetical protein [Marivirga sp.]